MIMCGLVLYVDDHILTVDTYIGKDYTICSKEITCKHKESVSGLDQETYQQH